MNDIEILISALEDLKEKINFDHNKERFENNTYKSAINYALATIKERQADKDRIKEKIEWLREISDNGINAVRFAATHDDEIERMQKQRDISTMISILQELLGEKE